MTIALTGADGFLGSNLSRELLSRGYRIRALVQPGRDTATIDELDLERAPVNILDPESVSQAIEGCDAVIHTAANTSFWPARSPKIWQINLDGTKNVLEACRKHRVKRLVHVGTANTFAAGTKENPGDETRDYDSHDFRMDYMDSKYEAHRLVRSAVGKGDVPAVEVNPTFMWGPYDRVPAGGKMILRVSRKEVPGFAPGGKNCVSVKDVAVATANALTMGNVGESYILGNRNMSYAEIFNAIAGVVGKSVPQRPFPAWLVKLTGMAGSIRGRFTGREPRLSYLMAKISCSNFYYTAAKAVRELQLPQTPVEVAIEEAHDWFLENGYVYDRNGRLHRHLPMPTLAYEQSDFQSAV